MPHAIWRGTVSFGLVTIPVTVLPALDTSANLSFHMLDGTDLAPIKQRRVNANSGEEVPYDRIVKGYELEPGRWVVLADDDFKAANVEATRTIDIVSAVCADEIDPTYFNTPYFLEPAKEGRKAYALLRETLRETGRVAIARVVLRTREHLAALIPSGEMLMLELLRFPHELRSAEGIDLPSADLAEEGVTEAELAMAKQLVSTIEASFDPDSYRDSYRDDLLALIARKAEGAEVAAAPAQAEPGGEVVDIVAMLKASLEAARERA